MTRLPVLMLGLLITCTVKSQNLANSRTNSPYTYIFSISEKQALDLIRKGSTGKDEKLFSVVVDSFPTGTKYKGKLKPGNYVTAFVDYDKVRVEYTSVPNVHLAVIDNKTDLVIQVRDTTGRLIENADVRRGIRTLPGILPQLHTGLQRATAGASLLLPMTALPVFSAWKENLIIPPFGEPRGKLLTGPRSGMCGCL